MAFGRLQVGFSPLPSTVTELRAISWLGGKYGRHFVGEKLYAGKD